MYTRDCWKPGETKSFPGLSVVDRHHLTICLIIGCTCLLKQNSLGIRETDGTVWMLGAMSSIYFNTTVMAHLHRCFKSGRIASDHDRNFSCISGFVCCTNKDSLWDSIFHTNICGKNGSFFGGEQVIVFVMDK